MIRLILLIFCGVWVFDRMEEAEDRWTRMVLGLFLLVIGCLIGRGVF